MSTPSFSRRPLAALGLTGLAAAAFARPAEAQTIDDVLGKKKVQVGILVDLPPFGVVNAKNEYEGYDVDVAKLMAKYLGVECELVPVTGPNRIPYLLTGRWTCWWRPSASRRNVPARCSSASRTAASTSC